MNIASRINPILTLEYMTTQKEGQYFECKSAQIKPSDTAQHISAFANAAGGTLVIGISDKTRRVEGLSAQTDEKVNLFVSAPKDCCHPMPEYETEFLSVTNVEGQPDQILLLHIKPSTSQIIYTTNDSVYLRIGDKSKEMKGDDLRNLEYIKGSRHWEDELNQYATIDDLDQELLQDYKMRIGAAHLSTEQVFRAQTLLVTKDGKQYLTNAAVILFAKQPKMFYPHCRLRFLRYEGTQARPGRHFNVVKDKEFELPLLKMFPAATTFIADQLREFTHLTKEALFETEPEYPEFAWQESIANAIAHRAWGLYGDYIRVSMYDDRLEIFSPGRLPNIVTVENIRETRFARNPIICNVLNAFNIVKQLNEGVTRVFEEMQDLGLPEPEIKDLDGGVKVILHNNIALRANRETVNLENETVKGMNETVNETVNSESETVTETIIRLIKANPAINYTDLAKGLKVSRATIGRYIQELVKSGIIIRIGSDKTGHWEIK